MTIEQYMVLLIWESSGFTKTLIPKRVEYLAHVMKKDLKVNCD